MSLQLSSMLQLVSQMRAQESGIRSHGPYVRSTDWILSQRARVSCGFATGSQSFGIRLQTLMGDRGW